MNTILLTNPKNAHNVGNAVRAVGCWGPGVVLWVGDRVTFNDGKKGFRLPREERLPAYGDVTWRQTDDKPFDDVAMLGLTPVAVELAPGAELSPHFEHPENPAYVFGPEDGSIPSVYLRHCHRVLKIPTRRRYPLNLAAAVNVILYDRFLKAELCLAER